MKKIHFFGLLIICMFFLVFIDCSKKMPNWKNKNRYNKKQLNIKKRNNMNKIAYKYMRRIEEEEEVEGRYNTSFVPLNIFIDLINFNWTFPNDTFGYETKDIFVKAINRAKKILESYLYYQIDYDFVNTMDVDYFENFYSIIYYNKTIINTTLHNYNFFILFNFINDEDEPIALYDIAIDDAGTPVGGIISINMIMEQKEYSNVHYLTNLMLHQFIHLLGFDLKVLFQTNVTLNYRDKTFTKETFPNLFKYAENYFGCTVEQIEMQSDQICNVDDIHFPSRFFLGELMTNFNYPEEQILSGFTLALLDDFPHLRVVQNFTGGLMRFGKHKGIDFINKDCIEDFEKSDITFGNEFYFIKNLGALPTTFEPSCSSGRLSKTVHVVYEEEGLDGPEKTDYCPISEFNGQNSEDIYMGHCNQNNNAINEEELQSIIKESFTTNSFCVLSSLVPEDSSDKSKIRAVCYEMYCSSRSLTIRIGDNFLVCPRSGGKIKAENLNLHGYLLCPDYNLICTGKEECNSNYDCFLKQSNEKKETFNYDYDIKTTQVSEIYEEEEVINGYELGQNGKCSFMCSQCDSNKICKKCSPQYKLDENNNKACIKKDPNCESYENYETTICSQCKLGYSLAKEDDGNFLCVDNTEHHYYSTEDSSDPSFSYLIKCRNGVSNCDICESSTKCTKCLNDDNYKVVDDGTACEELSSKTIYWDETAGKYKYCSYKDSKCSKCQLDNNNHFECLECESGYALFHEGNEPIECIATGGKTLSQYYTEDEGKNYYPCNNFIQYCETCENKQTCLTCQNSYDLVTVSNEDNKLCINLNEKKYYQDPDNNNYYFLCETSLSNCLTCDTKTKCNTCQNNYVIEEHDTCIPYSSVTSQIYFLDTAITKYALCSSRITNCQTCTSNSYCVACIENFAIIGEDHSQCEDLSTKKYYKDNELNQYKLCSFKLANCETCSVDSNNQFICEKCEALYALKHDNNNNIQCSLKTELDNNNEYYTNDLGINYYSCSNLLFNDVSNCKECFNKDSCSRCKESYKLVNNNKDCMLQSDIDNNIIFFNPNTNIYTPCSELISLCHKCDSETSCTECGQDGKLEESNSCISNELVENHNYFKDSTTGKYVSCSIIDNCITCSSKTVCTKCKEGFNVNNNICQIISSSEKKLSTGAIVGIAFGCLGFLLIVGGVVYFLLNKSKNKEINTIETEEKVEVKEFTETKEEEIKRKKRSIHNA